jgi:SAM-dependent methyltransferase
MTQQILANQHSTWQEKPVLRAIYTDYYRRIVESCVPGTTLEIGGGSGNLKQFLNHVISTDLVPTRWVDAAADAQMLPFADNSFANLVGVDILHHIENPRRVLCEIDRTLRPGGRLVLLEPAITPISSIFYRLFHPEPVDMGQDPLSDAPPDPNRLPFDANQGIPTLLFGKHLPRMQAMFPDLRLLKLERFSLLAYPLSGGFRRWCLIPQSMVHSLLKIEQTLLPALGRLMAFRILVVLEKHQ